MSPATSGPVCGAKTRAGGTCRQPPVKGNRRCRYHGGLSLRGPASPTWKTGKYSKVVPKRLSEAYEKALNDPELVALTEQIALCDARSAELLQRLDTTESSQAWIDNHKALQDLLRGNRTGDRALVNDAVRRLQECDRRGNADREQWEDLRRIMEQRRRLSDTERKRLDALQNYITAEQAMGLAARIADIARKRITDRKQLNLFVIDLMALAGVNRYARSGAEQPGEEPRQLKVIEHGVIETDRGS